MDTLKKNVVEDHYAQQLPLLEDAAMVTNRFQASLLEDWELYALLFHSTREKENDTPFLEGRVQDEIKKLEGLGIHVNDESGPNTLKKGKITMLKYVYGWLCDPGRSSLWKGSVVEIRPNANFLNVDEPVIDITHPHLLTTSLCWRVPKTLREVEGFFEREESIQADDFLSTIVEIDAAAKQEGGNLSRLESMTETDKLLWWARFYADRFTQRFTVPVVFNMDMATAASQSEAGEKAAHVHFRRCLSNDIIRPLRAIPDGDDINQHVVDRSGRFRQGSVLRIINGKSAQFKAEIRHSDGTTEPFWLK